MAGVAEEFAERAAEHAVRFAQQIPGRPRDRRRSGGREHGAAQPDRQRAARPPRRQAARRSASSAETRGSFVELAVADDGVGFEPALAEKLFEKFYRPGDELRRTSKGTGLGLYVVRRFVELERGWVAAASPGPGCGATFTVAWPAATPDAADDGEEVS